MVTMPRIVNGWKLDDSELDKVIYSPVCLKCKHLTDFEKHACKAFSSIPDEIWDGKNDHKKPYAGDNGIQFEANK